MHSFQLDRVSSCILLIRSILSKNQVSIVIACLDQSFSPRIFACPPAWPPFRPDPVCRFDLRHSDRALPCRGRRLSPTPLSISFRPRARPPGEARMTSSSGDPRPFDSQQHVPLRPRRSRWRRLLRSAAPFEVGCSCGSQDTVSGSAVPAASDGLSSAHLHITQHRAFYEDAVPPPRMVRGEGTAASGKKCFSNGMSDAAWFLVKSRGRLFLVGQRAR